MSNDRSKQIIALSDFEHVRKRPTMYVGSVDISDERVQLIHNGRLIELNKQISVGFYKLINEILDNSFDEAKRMKGKLKNINISFNSKTNEVSVSDTGNGFFEGTEINPKTGISNIETAMIMLRAGSNFHNENTEEALIGTNGVGAAVVNMLSSKFSITTINSTHYYHQEWENFVEKTKEIRPRKRGDKLGTKVSFIPSKEIFKNSKWDKEYVRTLMTMKEFLRYEDPVLSKLKFEVKFDGELMNITESFIPEESIMVEFKHGYVIFMPHKRPHELKDFKGHNYGTADVSFVNGALCVGAHQRVVNDYISTIYDYNYAYQFVDTFFVMNLPPKLVRFGDQNKTKYVIGRWEIEPILNKTLEGKVKHGMGKRTEFYKLIKEIIDKHVSVEHMKLVKREKRKSAKSKTISDKYFPPTKRNGTLFLVEGDSAKGSILQKRDSETDGVYALRGKLKNARNLIDLASNNEIVDIMNILNIEPNDGKKCSYDKVVIATDWDPDGIGHIASLIINLFWRWFPTIINDRKLCILITPLISVDIKAKREYFYSQDKLNEWAKTNKKYTNIRYLKGLGSLSLPDWEYVMHYRDMWALYNDRSAGRYLNMAFNSGSNQRKKWLKGEAF